MAAKTMDDIAEMFRRLKFSARLDSRYNQMVAFAADSAHSDSARVSSPQNT